MHIVYGAELNPQKLNLSQQNLWCLTDCDCLIVPFFSKCGAGVFSVGAGRSSFLWLHNCLICFICYLSLRHQNTPLHTRTLKTQTLKVHVFITETALSMAYLLMFSFLSTCQRASNYIHKHCSFPSYITQQICLTYFP